MDFPRVWGRLVKLEAIAAASVWIWPGEGHQCVTRLLRVSRKPGTRNNWRKPTTEAAGSRNSMMECGFLHLESGFWSSKILFYFQRSRKRRAAAVKAALQQEKQVGRFENCETEDVESSFSCPCGIVESESGRLALMAGAASWQALGHILFISIYLQFAMYQHLLACLRATRMFKKIGDLGVASRCSNLTSSLLVQF